MTNPIAEAEESELLHIAYLRGAQEERAEIMDWLRRIRSIKSCMALADAIESGAHRKDTNP